MLASPTELQSNIGNRERISLRTPAWLNVRAGRAGGYGGAELLLYSFTPPVRQADRDPTSPDLLIFHGTLASAPNRRASASGYGRRRHLPRG
jgi:hypothetical protein